MKFFCEPFLLIQQYDIGKAALGQKRGVGSCKMVVEHQDSSIEWVH